MMRSVIEAAIVANDPMSVNLCGVDERGGLPKWHSIPPIFSTAFMRRGMNDLQWFSFGSPDVVRQVRV